MRRLTSADAARFAEPTGADIDRLCAIILERTGMTVSEAKRGVVAVRVGTRLRQLGLRSIDAYCRLVERDDPELLFVIDLVTTHETSFFRQPDHFAFLEHHLLPHFRTEAARGQRPHEVRVWSAGCSTGEEPYSIAMVLRSGLSTLAGWRVDVLATDISEAALETARRGVFSTGCAWQIYDDYRRLFMQETTYAGRPVLRVAPEIAESVRFERLNLLDDFYPAGRDYDVIFCRNVLIYFRPEERPLVVDRLIDHLAADGHLVLGQAEGLLGASRRLRRVGPTVYRVESPPIASSSRFGSPLRAAGKDRR